MSAVRKTDTAMNSDFQAMQASQGDAIPALPMALDALAVPGHATDALRLPALLSDLLGHELRSPLSAILMSAEVLKRKPDAALRNTGARLARSAQWMGRMVRDMQDLTRCQLGSGLALQPEACDMAPLLQQVIEERGLAFPRHRLRLSQQGPLHGHWDAVRMRQLLSGLLGNALHHGDASEPVDIVADGTAADTVQLRLHNGGCIAAPVLAHVFDPLHADARRGAPPEGLGFGLYIGREIARAHGGELQLQSSVASGTLVTLTLPRGAATAPLAPATSGH